MRKAEVFTLLETGSIHVALTSFRNVLTTHIFFYILFLLYGDELKALVFASVFYLFVFGYADVQKIPEFKGTDLNKQTIDYTRCLGKFNLFLFFDPINSDHKGKIKYAQVLSNRYRDLHLNVIGISKNEAAYTSLICEISNVSYSVIPDSSNIIHNLFGVNDCCGGTILTNRKAEIIFSSKTLIPSEHLRQLVEKTVLGEISYDFAGARWVSPYQRGEIFPNQDIIDVRSGNVLQLSKLGQERAVITFFSTFCSSCKQGTRIQSLVSLNLSAGIRCYLAFLQPFEPQDIHDIEVRFSLPFDKYIFKNFLSDNNIYLTSEAKRCDPWTIVIDRDRTILFAESLGSTESQLIKDIADVLKKNRLFD